VSHKSKLGPGGGGLSIQEQKEKRSEKTPLAMAKILRVAIGTPQQKQWRLGVI
jgi:hypothetical protein